MPRKAAPQGNLPRRNVVPDALDLRDWEIAPFVIDMGNNGHLSGSGRFRTQPGDPVDLAIYAHGGLTGEDDVAATAAKWIPALYDANIFPIFLMWETDLWSTLKNRLEDLITGQPRPTGSRSSKAMIVEPSKYEYRSFTETILQQRLLLVITVILGLVTGSNSSSAESLDNLAGIVRVEHTRSFTDVELLAFSLETAPSVAVQLPKGSSPSELIKQVYGFGASNSREAYDLVEARILTINNAEDATKLRAGKVLIPDLPVMTSKSTSTWGSTGPIVRNPSAMVRTEKDIGPAQPKFAYSKPVRIGAPIADSLIYTRLERYPATEAARIIDEAKTQKREVAGGIEVGIQLATNPADCNEVSTKVLSADERYKIAAALKRSADQTERYLIVLDTGWPTVDDQVRSLRYLRRILDMVRSSLRLPQSTLSRFTPSVPETAFVPTAHLHACMVAQSLREFVALDEDQRIKIIFLPLRPGQFTAHDVFRELIELDQLIIALGGNQFKRSPNTNEIALASNFARDALAQLETLKKPWPAGDDVVGIYEPLISGLIRILDAYARITPVSAPGMAKVDVRFWLSLSWNFTKFAATPSLPSSSNYMVFAAAGNDQADFVVARRLFASEAVMGHRVFAVMNNDKSSGALTCNSAHFAALWIEENADSNIGSYPGQLGAEPSQLCPGPGGGTSFSTPRLAWLTAASDISSRADDMNWPKILSIRLLKSREKIDNDPNAAPVRVMRLIK